MTRKQLEEYRSNRDEIRELEYRLAHLGEDETLIVSSVVMDYRTGFPRPRTVTGIDENEYGRRRRMYQATLTRIRGECEEVEQWIEQIPDALTRRIFRMRFVDGLTQREIGKRVYLSQASVSEKISAFLKVR